MQASEEMKKYFENIEKEVKRAYAIAEKARKLGFDPEKKVEIPIARNMAERVEGLISSLYPQIIGSGVIDRIIELEKKYGAQDWRVALIIAREVAQEKFCKFKDIKEAMEAGIRVGFSYATSGIVAAPLEGFVELVIRKTKDGKDYIAVKYAGPIRGAGGTAAAFSLLIVDYVRKAFNFADYDASQEEIARAALEIQDYHEKVTNLQYLPSEEEVKFLYSHLPIQVDGDPTEKIEVSNYKDLDRIDTPCLRGGFCLVLAEGLAQKAKKIYGRISKWMDEFDLSNWNFLKEFLEIQARIKSKIENKIEDKAEKISEDYTFIADLVSGRPVLAYPMARGGFRLRYGRSRTSGYSACSINPILMHLLDGFIAIGTQLKVERPGKAAAVTSCSYLEPPIVLTDDGSVIKVRSIQQARELKGKIKKILYLGDILFSYGDFLDRNHVLVPAGYCEEWWIQELEKAVIDHFGTLDYEKVADFLDLSVERVKAIMKNYFEEKPTAIEAIEISKKFDIPLHPEHTFFWKFLSKDDFKKLYDFYGNAKIESEHNIVMKVILPFSSYEKKLLEILGVEHKVINNEFIILEGDTAHIMNFFMIQKYDFTKEGKALDFVNSIIKVRDKAGTFIGARMGRPEKAKMRKLKGSPQVLFPVGEEGSRFRSIQAAVEAGKVRADFPIFYCENCKRETIYQKCEICFRETKKLKFCRFCGYIKDRCKHGKGKEFYLRDIDIKHYLEAAMKHLGINHLPELIKGVRGTSNKDHLPENLAKGILRAVNKIYVNKDGTTRYDMTELPITHFKAREIGISIDKLKELGYDKDIYGKDIESPDQIIELKPQDIILPESPETLDETSAEVLIRVANFVDDLLVKFYKLEPYYNIKSKEDLIGHLVICLAPHISAGTVARIIGFSKVQGCLAHPLLHAALRRDCDGDECCIILLMDALLNFSRRYLPDKRGSRTMDSPLVLTTIIIPSEVDDMVHKLDLAWRYPLSFYEAALNYKQPDEVDIPILKKRLNSKEQYEGFGFTHDTDDINNGVLCSSYKSIPTMEEKLEGQLKLAEIITAVDESNVASLVIEKHFLKDIKGNLRKFSIQQFRCSKCNEKYRRVPLVGKCIKCGGNIIFTVSEGTIVKYLEPSLKIAEKYNVPEYIKQTLSIIKTRIEAVFGKEKEVQEDLARWF